ncbi:MAG: 50S ribosomal protein L28 [Clostridiaceae bacterium]
MSRKCDYCDKGVVAGVSYSHSHRQSKRTWAPNLKKIRAVVNGTPKRVMVCTRCLRSGKVERAM